MNRLTARFPLLAREWSIVARAARIGLALVGLGVAFLFVACRAEDRYRLLAEPVMLRTVVLPAAVGIGAVVAWLSVVREMRSGTWDGWLLVPRSRATLAGAKLGVGVVTSVAVVALPVVALWLVLHVLPAIGGPTITIGDLLLRSVLTQGVLLAIVTYLAVANAAQMARASQVAFVAPLGLSLFASARFFSGDGGFHDVPVRAVELGLLAAAAFSAVSLVLSIRRWGQPLAATELSLRSLLATPATTVAVLFAGLVAAELSVRAGSPPSTSARGARTSVGLDANGRIVTVPGSGHALLGMYRFAPLAELEEHAPLRLWTPAYTGTTFQIFLERDADRFLVYENGTGRPLGALGRGGLGDATPFDARPVALRTADDAILLTPNEVLRLDDDGALHSLLRGAVHGAVRMTTEDSRDGVALAIDDGVVFLPSRDGEPLGRDEGGAPSVSPIASGIVAPGWRATAITIGDGFAGVEVASATEVELVAADADGRVVERRHLGADPAGAPLAPSPPTLRRRVLGLAVGPLFGAVLTRMPSAHTEREVPPSPWGAIGVAGVATALLFVASRRRAHEHARAWWLLPGLVLGPGYALACALVLWRPRWASLLG